MKYKNIKILNPLFLKKLNILELNNFAKQIRKLFLKKNQGHLSSNLATIETIIALNYVFHYKKDVIIFDTGHQAYLQKILTYKKNFFNNLGEWNGISTFINIKEDKNSYWSGGHAGTGLSIALSYAINNKLNNLNKNIILHIGDCAFGNGINLQALNDINIKKQKIILILNDNQMGIGPYISNLSDISRKIFNSKIKQKQNNAIKTIKKFFNVFNFEYINVENGHSVKNIIEAFKIAKDNKKSIAIHINTIKGYGIAKYKSINSHHKIINKFSKDTYTNIVVECLKKKYIINEKIIILGSGMLWSNNFYKLRNINKNRIYDTNLAEEHAILLAGGLAKQGYISIVYIYSTFLQRCYDQLYNDLYLNNLRIILLIDRCNYIGFDGESHHGFSDIGLLSLLPNFIITMPNSINTINVLITTAIKWNRKYSFAIRFNKGEISKNNFFKEIEKINSPIWIKWNLNNKKYKIIIISYGESLNYLCKHITEELKNKILIVNALFIKPIDLKMMLSLIKTSKLIICYEWTNFENSLFKIIINSISLKILKHEYLKNNNWIKKLNFFGIKSEIIQKQGNIYDFLNSNKINWNYFKIFINKLINLK